MYLQDPDLSHNSVLSFLLVGGGGVCGEGKGDHIAPHSLFSGPPDQSTWIFTSILIQKQSGRCSGMLYGIITKIVYAAFALANYVQLCVSSLPKFDIFNFSALVWCLILSNFKQLRIFEALIGKPEIKKKKTLFELQINYFVLCHKAFTKNSECSQERRVFLKVTEEHLSLLDFTTKQLLVEWGLHTLRRYGSTKDYIQFEAGR